MPVPPWSPPPGPHSRRGNSSAGLVAARPPGGSGGVVSRVTGQTLSEASLPPGVARATTITQNWPSEPGLTSAEYSVVPGSAVTWTSGVPAATQADEVSTNRSKPAVSAGSPSLHATWIVGVATALPDEGAPMSGGSAARAVAGSVYAEASASAASAQRQAFRRRACRDGSWTPGMVE